MAHAVRLLKGADPKLAQHVLDRLEEKAAGAKRHLAELRAWAADLAGQP